MNYSCPPCDLPLQRERNLISNLKKNSKPMATISPLDTIFVTVIRQGITCLRTSITGIESLNDLVGRMRSIQPDLNGMLTFDVRNSTEGWSSRHSVYLR